MMVSVNILWLVVGGAALVVIAVLSALRWNGRSTRGQHSFYARELSVSTLTAEPTSAGRARRGPR